jgi:threonyl-tRNA synthetase
VGEALGRAGVRVEVDDRNEKLGFKIREAETQKVPVMLVVGDEEAAQGTVNPRRRHAQKGASPAIALEAFVGSITDEIQRRGR